MLDTLAVTGVGVAVIAAGVALAADLPEAAVALGSVAVTMAMFAAVLPMLAAVLQRMGEEDVAPNWTPTWWLFGLGAVYAAVDGADLGWKGQALAAVLLIAIVWQLIGCAKAMRGLLSAFASGAVARMGVTVGGMLAAAAALGRIASIAGQPRIGDPLTEGAMDGAVLALGFFAILLALAPDPQAGEDDDLLLPPRWGQLYLFHNCGAIGVACVQVWVWRFHGATETVVMVLAGAGAIAATSLLLSGIVHQRRRGAAVSPPWPVVLAALLLAAEVYFVLSAATFSVQGGGQLLTSVALPIWPWGWRLPLLLVAMVALQAAGRRPGAVARGVWAQAVAIGVLLVGQYLWVLQSSLAGTVTALGGVGILTAYWLGRRRP
jgi:hypothetical protein